MRLKDLIDFQLLSFNRICDKIRTGEHFSFARYGDGEFNAMLGENGANCDGHTYFPEMGAELGRILSENPPYYVGLHQSARIENKTLEWLFENTKARKFAANAVFHDALVGKDNDGVRTVVKENVIDQLWAACGYAKVAIIAPHYVHNQRVVTCDIMKSLVIPGKDTYRHIEQIRAALGALDFTGYVVFICASMCAPILVDDLHGKYGDTATFIDFGSTFDPFVGVKSRSFHEKIKQA